MVDYKRFSHTRAAPQCRQGLAHQFPVTSGMLTLYYKMIPNVILSWVYKQNLCLVNKGWSSQGYGFSSGYVWMWELDY